MPDNSSPLPERVRAAHSRDTDQDAPPALPYRNIGDVLEHHADVYEQKPFLVFYSEEGQRSEISYREFHEEVCKSANALRTLGIGRGSRVATISFNHPDLVTHYFAAFLLGAVIVTVDPLADEEQIAKTLRHAGASVALVRDRLVDTIIKLRPPSLTTIVEVGSHLHTDLPHWQTLLQTQLPRFIVRDAVASDAAAMVIAASGIEGATAWVTLTHENVLAETLSIAETLKISDDQKLMCVLPVYHANGLLTTLMTPFLAGGGVVLNQRFQSERFFERISIERVTMVGLVPALLRSLIRAKLDMEAYKLAQFRCVICSNGPLTVELAQKFEQTFRVPLVHCYGLTETSSLCSSLPAELPAQEHRAWLTKHGFPSIGTPLPLCEMNIHDGEGNEKGEKERGEIVVRGPNVMAGYDDDAIATEAAFAHGWLRTGDEGFFHYDEEGRKFYFITGRMREMIMRGGSAIPPMEVDEVLAHIPGIELGIAVGFDNDACGREVGAVVKVKDGAIVTEDAVLAFCRKHLPFAMRPKAVVLQTSIPVTPAGKYRRQECASLFARWKATRFSEQA